MTDHANPAARLGFDLVQRDPPAAHRLLGAVLDDPQAEAVERATALWGLGRLATDANDISTALIRFPEAVRTASDTPDDQRPTLIAGIRVSWSVALNMAGQTDAAMDQLALAEPDLDGAALGRLRMQRAVLLAAGGQRAAAVAEYDEGLPLLLAGGDELAAARLLSNRGVAHLQLGQLRLAERDFRAAEELAVRLEQHLLAAGATHNAAYLDGRLGRVPEALHGFAVARQRYAAIGSPGRYLSDLDIDEAGVLLEAGLGEEATEVAGRVVAACRRDGNRSQLAEALVTMARAQLLAGQWAGARESAQEAEGLCDDDGRDAWSAISHYLVLSAERGGAPSGEGLRDVVRLRRLVTRLDRHGWAVEAIELRALMARGALHAGRPQLAAGLLRDAARARRSANARVRAEAWLTIALGHLAAGRPTAARRALADGLRTVERYRSTLGTGELRSAAGRLGAGLAELGVELAVDDHDGRRVLAWAERWRAGALGLPPAEPIDVPADLLDRLRQARLTVAEHPAGAAATDELARLELAVGRAMRARRGAATGPPSPPDRRLAGQLDQLGRRVLVEFLHSRGRLHAVVCRDGRVALHDLGGLDAARLHADHLRFAVRRLASGREHTGQRRARAAFELAAGELDGLLFGPLRAAIDGRPLLVVPSADLHQVMWSALPTADRPGGLVTAPSLAWWSADRPPTGGGGSVLVAGPDLAHAEGEVGALATLLPGARQLTGPDATVDAVLAAMSGADVVHLAVHGTFRADNPWFSTLQLADGHVHLHELDRVRAAPDTVVIAACSSGRSRVLAGDELLGTAAAFAGLGVRTIIAPQAPIADQASTAVALAVHRARLDGTSPAEAVAATMRAALNAGDGPTAAAAASFVCMTSRRG